MRRRSEAVIGTCYPMMTDGRSNDISAGRIHNLLVGGYVKKNEHERIPLEDPPAIPADETHAAQYRNRKSEFRAAFGLA